MAGHKTILIFDNYKSDPFEVTNGLDQGDPPSSVFYSSYNANLIIPSPNELKSAFIDNTIFLATGTTFKEK